MKTLWKQHTLIEVAKSWNVHTKLYSLFLSNCKSIPSEYIPTDIFRKVILVILVREAKSCCYLFIIPLLCYICLHLFFLIKEATRLALVSGDQATYARSIRIMGDIYRKKSEINVSILIVTTWFRNMLLEFAKGSWQWCIHYAVITLNICLLS